MARYSSPTNSEIIGTLERLSGRAEITGIDPVTGEPEYMGETEVFWDDQKTVAVNGQIVFLDENGDEWFFHQLLRVNEEMDNA